MQVMCGLFELKLLCSMIGVTLAALCILKLAAAAECGGDKGPCEFWNYNAQTLFITAESLDQTAVLGRVLRRSFLHCCLACDVLIGCSGVAFRDGECHLLNATAAVSGFVASDGGATDYKIMMFRTEGEYQIGHVCTGNCLQCVQPPYTDCKTLLALGYTADGVYKIHPGFPFDAYCDMTGGGWTVIQRRVDNAVDFYRGWNDYLSGFGDLTGNFWAGLDKIDALTPCCDQTAVELHVSMSTFEGEEAFAHYSQFGVGCPESGYLLTVAGYTGTAGDAMANHNNMKFTTFDKDQDSWAGGNCVTDFKGGWWYNICHDTNPNGPMLPNPCPYAQGMVWRQYRGYTYSLKSIQFKIRRI